MARWYIKDTDRLGLGRPDAEPYATEYVEQIIELIERLIEGGSAYACEGDVYFRVRTLAHYGELSRRDVDQMDQGEGVEGADLKEDPLDFALWKAWKEGEDTSWDAPWGRGRPGWHIECSAMAEALLGVEFDIHGGGVDLVFPHHENEAAQTFAARGKPLARIWMHNGMLELGRRRRCRSRWATSAGSARCSTRSTAEVFVLFMSTGHYRQPLAFSDEALEDARRSAARIREAGRRLLARAVAGRRWRRTATPSSPRCATTSTPPRRWPRCTGGSARRTAPRRPSATRTWSRCSTCSGWSGCWRPRRAAAGGGRARRAARDGARARRTGPRPTACATSCARWAGRSATGPTVPSWSAA